MLNIEVKQTYFSQVNPDYILYVPWKINWVFEFKYTDVQVT